MVKERQQKYCYLNLSDDDDEETLDLEWLYLNSHSLVRYLFVTLTKNIARMSTLCYKEA